MQGRRELFYVRELQAVAYLAGEAGLTRSSVPDLTEIYGSGLPDLYTFSPSAVDIGAKRAGTLDLCKPERAFSSRKTVTDSEGVAQDESSTLFISVLCSQAPWSPLPAHADSHHPAPSVLALFEGPDGMAAT